ncbi:MAG: squalene--hopene cyclase [Planctomycetaceae bacterium]|nr:squalene--hopene cyclase [Planctomycetaceae bacterium]
MESGRQHSRFIRLDNGHPVGTQRFSDLATDDVSQNQPGQDASPLGRAISATTEFLLANQHADGYWVGELEGDTILESEYILLLTYLGEEGSADALAAARYIVEKQEPHGGWALYPGGPLEISATVKAYWALKITGHDPQAEYMQRARQAILAAGGAEQVNSFTRYYMALLGLISYRQCPAVPPELILLPRWTGVTIYEMSAWSRTILIPLSLLWAYKPSRALPAEWRIDEVFTRPVRQLSAVNNVTGKVDNLSYRTWVPWAWIFRQFDRCYKLMESLGEPPYRKKAIRMSSSWMLDRFAQSDGLGAIFPPIVWSLVALKCLGFEETSQEFRMTREHLDRLILRGQTRLPDGTVQETVRLQPCHSPVWDTAISTLALQETGQPQCQPAIQAAAEWLRSKEVRFPGDWSMRHPGVEPAGWYFEFNNEFYPDIDDTTMVLMALSKSLPKDLHADWMAEFIPTSETPGESRLSTLVSGKASEWQGAIQDVSRLQPVMESLRRGVQWILAMQSRNGGWGAFDADNDCELLTRVPFADHNAMIDPPTADITARVLESLATLGIDRRHPAVEQALRFLWQHQEEDGSWHGRWGVNYIYGTWQVLVGLNAIGIPQDDPRIRDAVHWLKSVQLPDGGWGESPETYEHPERKGAGPATASQTAWALLGLLAAGEVHSDSVQRGVNYLLQTQCPDGTWKEQEFTGTGFPRVFYLKYHYYRVYFPLMALSRYRQLQQGVSGSRS